MKHKKILFSSMAALSLLVNANANETELDEVSVWETQVISSSLNLGENTIETKQADHLSDLLRDIPGVEVGGTHSINNRINIRGFQDEDINITIDGAKVQNVRMFHHIGNLLINPDILKKADIQVGTNSVVNGGLAGSIAFETKDGKDMLEKGKDFGARISTTYNSNDSLGGSISGYGKVSDKFSFLLYHNYVNKNDWEYPSGEKTFGYDGKTHDTLIKGTYDLSDSQTISVSYDKMEDKGDYNPRPNMNSAANIFLTGNSTFPTEYTRDTLTLKHNLNLGDKLVLDTTLYSNENELKRYETWTRSPRPTLEGELDGKASNYGINTKAQSNLKTGSILNTFTYGFQYDDQQTEVKWNGAQYGLLPKETAKELALFAEDAVMFENGLIVTPGVRYTNYKLDSNSGSFDENEFTYGLALEYPLSETVTLQASGTTLFRGIPMVEVLASTRTTDLSNPSLKPETGINKEVGFTYMNDNVLNADKVGFTFKYFRTTIEDLVNTDTMVNEGNVNLKGFEATFKVIKNSVTGTLGLSKTDAEYSQAVADENYKQGDKLTLGLDYKLNSSVDLSWNSIFVMKEDDVGTLTGITSKPGYGVHNMSVKYVPESLKNLSVIAGVDNIFDKEYINHTSTTGTARGTFTGDYEPGRNYKVTLAYRF